MRIRKMNKDLFKKWKSIRESSRQLKISHSNIVGVLKGNRKSAGKYKWCYYE